ncbi:MAG TPA: pseudouridine synthase [Terriglobales bacterium]|nr:pseudouridine synthase [Terriglobales bacterium]
MSWQRDRIEVEGRAVAARAKVYLMLNKPRGVVTTASDEKGRQTVYAGLDADLPWVGPLGRLDKASEGLLLLSNDSEWAARLMAPQTHLDKTYHVQVASLADEPLLAALKRGVPLGKGKVLRAKEFRLLRTGSKNSWLEIVLDEGKNRHIRRMLEGCGVEVLRVVRVAIGPLTLGRLAKGSSRYLTKEEKRSLDVAITTSSSRLENRLSRAAVERS